MSKFKTMLTLMRKPRKMIKPLGHIGIFNWLPDKPYLKLVYWAETGRRLNIDSPSTFNEKLQWLKLYNRKPEYSNYVDKYTVRSFIQKTIGEEYLIPLIGVYNNVEEINWEMLSNKFIIKCNHGSGTNIICTDKNSFDIKEAKRRLNKWMKKSWYWFGREWPYKNVKKKIIIEELLQDKNRSVPMDYKCWVFNGKVEFINVHFKDNGRTKINIYNRDWELQSFGMVYNNDLGRIHEKPKNYQKMIDFAQKISNGLPFVRVDFYEVNGKLYSGEITFYPTSGFIRFHPNHDELDKMYGDLLNLRLLK